MIIYDCYNRPYIDPLRKAVIENWDLNDKEGKTMIKANELRIGNLLILNLNYKEVIHRVDEIYTDEVKVTSIEDGGFFPRMALRTCNPIPLTSEWLERCGFKDPAGNGWGYRININSADELCWYMQDGFLRYQTQGSGFTRQLEHIKYVHQLQNIYHALTGEELNVKL